MKKEWTKGKTEEGRFAITAQIAKLPDMTEIKCINGLLHLGTLYRMAL